MDMRAAVSVLKQDLQTEGAKRTRLLAKLEAMKSERADLRREWPEYVADLDQRAILVSKELIKVQNRIKAIQSAIEDFSWGVETLEKVKENIVGFVDLAKLRNKLNRMVRFKMVTNENWAERTIARNKKLRKYQELGRKSHGTFSA